jgi:hypothetical protein
MSTKAARGTKRTCQSNSCGSRFYDLARDPILCPICGSQYVVASAGPGVVAPVAAPVARANDFDAEKPDDAPEASGEEVLADIEAGDEPVVVADDETFLEEEEDSSNPIGIAGGGEEPEET